MRIDHHDSAMQINGVIAEDKQSAVFLISQLAMPTYSLSGHALFDGLAVDKHYKLTILDQPASLRTGGVMKKLRNNFV